MRCPIAPPFPSPILTGIVIAGLLAMVAGCGASTPSDGGKADGSAGGKTGGSGGDSPGAGTGGSTMAGAGGAPASPATGGRTGTGTGGSTGTGGRGAGGAGLGGNMTGTGGRTGGTGGSTTVGASGLPTVPGAGGVAKPGGAPGNLTVVNWAGLKGAVTYTFDDANSSQIQHYGELNALGVPLSFFLITGKPEASDPVWKQALVDGHEVSNHTKSHTQIGTGADVDAATTFLTQTLGAIPYDMVAPYGDPSYQPLAMTRFLLNRGVSDCLIGAGTADTTDPYNLCCYIAPTGAAASAYNGEIDAAQSAGRWRIVLVHGFTGGTDGAFQPVSITEFTASVNHAKALGNLWIDTMINIGAYWRAQKVIAAVTPTSSGTSKVWTWTLPAHFPPGKYLRVSVPGGTVTQGGQTIAWNDHGYYEISLDAGSLTVAP